MGMEHRSVHPRPANSWRPNAPIGYGCRVNRSICITTLSLIALCAGCLSSGDSSTTAGGGPGPGSEADVDETRDRLRECDVYGEGDIRQVRDIPVTALSACILSCLAGADCGELSEFVCNYESSGDLDACQTACALEGSLTCPSGAVVASSAICDGVDNCVGGEDEQDCAEPVSDCRIDFYSVCDGYDDCEDGSDEVDCDYVRCDGDVVSPAYFCDGWDFCQDGSDEQGCAERTCDDF